MGIEWRLLLFYVEVDVSDEIQSLHKQQTGLNEIRITHHIHSPPLRKRRQYQEVWPPQGRMRMRGLPACRIPAAPAHIRCAEAIIARYVEFGKQGKNFKDNT